MSIVGCCQCNYIPEAHYIPTLYTKAELLKISRDIKVKFILQGYLKVEEIIQFLNIFRYLIYFHISLFILTNSPSDDSNIIFHVFLTFPYIDIVITVMMNSILNIFGYSEHIILGNYHLYLDPANTSAWQQLSLNSLIFY